VRHETSPLLILANSCRRLRGASPRCSILEWTRWDQLPSHGRPEELPANAASRVDSVVGEAQA